MPPQPSSPRLFSPRSSSASAPHPPSRSPATVPASAIPRGLRPKPRSSRCGTRAVCSEPRRRRSPTRRRPTRRRSPAHRQDVLDGSDRAQRPELEQPGRHPVENSGTLAAGTPAGTTRVVTLPAVPAGATCIVTQTADGHTADAVLASTTTVPASVVAVANSTVSATVTDAFAAPTPTPTPTPSPTSTRLPDTGASAPPSWGMPAALLTAGLAVIALDHVRRRSRASR